MFSRKGSTMTLIVYGLFILVIGMLFAPKIVAMWNKGANDVGDFTKCGVALKGKCLPKCPRDMTESPINAAGEGGCPPEEDNPGTNDDPNTKPDDLSYISNSEWIDKEYHDETRWNICCIEDFTAGN